jgi:hypothetical protein
MYYLCRIKSENKFHRLRKNHDRNGLVFTLFLSYKFYEMKCRSTVASVLKLNFFMSVNKFFLKSLMFIFFCCLRR